MLVSFVSAILVLGTPAEMYTRGTQLTLRVFGYTLSIVLSSLLFVPLFYKLKVTSAFEYLEMRYKSRVVKLIGENFHDREFKNVTFLKIDGQYLILDVGSRSVLI